MEAIKTLPNPLKGEHNTLSFKVAGFSSFNESTMKIYYIADRDIATDDDFTFWIEPFLEKKWDTAENLCAEILKNFYDSVLPFHIEIKFSYELKKLGITKRVHLTKNQPNYKKTAA